MKCADCKFWKHLPDGSMDDQEGGSVGECRRGHPRPEFETRIILLEKNRQDYGCEPDPKAPEPDGTEIESWGRRMATWPTTWETDFCGEFAPERETQGFV